LDEEREQPLFLLNPAMCGECSVAVQESSDSRPNFWKYKQYLASKTLAYYKPRTNDLNTPEEVRIIP